MTLVPAHVSTMPLHAVTEVYGEAGLRLRFAQEIADFPPAEHALLLDALDLAGALHRADRRVREPYVNHLLRVTIRILHYYRVRDVEVLCAALLHDAVEDHADELGGSTDAALGVLADRYSDRVADLVSWVTNPDYDPTRSAHEQYRAHVEASLTRHPWARVLKISDFTDNAVGVIHTTGPKVQSSTAKYAPLVPVLRRLVELPDTPLLPEVKQLIAGQLTPRRSALRRHPGRIGAGAPGVAAVGRPAAGTLGRMEITVVADEKKHRFEARTADGQLAGFIQYLDRGDTLVLVHTEVELAFDGQGVGSVLVRDALDQIRGRGLHIVPQCPFVAGYLKRHPEYQDLVAG